MAPYGSYDPSVEDPLIVDRRLRVRQARDAYDTRYNEAEEEARARNARFFTPPEGDPNSMVPSFLQRLREAPVRSLEEAPWQDPTRDYTRVAGTRTMTPQEAVAAATAGGGEPPTQEPPAPRTFLGRGRTEPSPMMDSGQTAASPSDVPAHRTFLGRGQPAVDTASPLFSDEEWADIGREADLGREAPPPPPEPAAEPAQRSFLRYRMGGDPWQLYDSTTGTSTPTAAPTGPAVSVVGRDPGEIPPSDLDIEDAERRWRLSQARTNTARAETEQSNLKEDPLGIRRFIAQREIESRIRAQDPQEQRRAEADARRAQEAQRLATLRQRLAEAGATPEEAQESIRQFVMKAALEQALRDGNYGPLASLLGRTQNDWLER